MPDAHTLLVFCFAALAIILVPGPAVLYIIARSMQQGTAAGLISSLGVATGGILHVLAATFGVSALITSYPPAFQFIKYLGAVYLIYMGIKTLTNKAGLEVATTKPQPLAEIYRQGVIVNALNPKTALFFMAFLPQFIQPRLGSVASQTFTLGVIFLLLAALSDSTYALLAGVISKKFEQSKYLASVQRYLTGCIFIFLGVLAATLHKT